MLALDDRHTTTFAELGYPRPAEPALLPEHALVARISVFLYRGRARGLFACAEDLAHRVAQLHRSELARLGAINSIEGVEHRRDALWQGECAGNPEGPCWPSRANGSKKKTIKEKRTKKRKKNHSRR